MRGGVASFHKMACSKCTTPVPQLWGSTTFRVGSTRGTGWRHATNTRDANILDKLHEAQECSVPVHTDITRLLEGHYLHLPAGDSGVAFMHVIA